MPELQNFPWPGSSSSRRRPMISPELDFAAYKRRLIENLWASTNCPKSLLFMDDLHFSDFYGPGTGPKLSSSEVEQAKYLDMSERFLELSRKLLEYKFLRYCLKTPLFMLASVISV